MKGDRYLPLIGPVSAASPQPLPRRSALTVEKLPRKFFRPLVVRGCQGDRERCGPRSYYLDPRSQGVYLFAEEA